MTPQSQTIISKLIELSLEHREMVGELEKFRRHVTIMFTDIQGSTAYFEKFGDVAGMIMVHECNNALRQVVELHEGRVLKTIGDAIMASFERCSQSVQAAIAMQKQLVSMNSTRPADQKIVVRIGLHYGSGIVKSNDVFGDVVNVASRVESVSGPGQVLISDSLQEQIQNSGFKIIPVGRFKLKGKEAGRGLFEVVWQQETMPQPLAVPSAAGESTVSRLDRFRIQHLTANGHVETVYELRDRLMVGRYQGELTFPADSTMPPLCAALSVENGQVLVEKLSPDASVFVRLTSVYLLQDGDLIMMGGQMLEFHVAPDAMALGAAMGVTLTDMTAMLRAPVAEFIALSGGGKAGASYPLSVEEVRFGRIHGTYTFPDDRRLSRTHARVYQRGEDFFLEDVGSRNGTFVKLREKASLTVGATVLVGQQLLRVSV